MAAIDRILLILLPVLLICVTSHPVDAANTNTTNQTEILIDREGYVLANGESRTFYQGYAIVIKGVDTKGEKTWIELLQNDTTVDYGIFKAGDHFNYTKRDEIFNITIDGIYVGSENDLVFFYVYQYPDPDLPLFEPPSTETPSTETSSSNVSNASITNATTPVYAQDTGSIPGYGACMAIGMLVFNLFRKNLSGKTHQRSRFR